MRYFKLPIYALAAALITAPTIANAWWWHWDDDDEIPFDEAEIYFELNDTDGDLGIHGKIDGGPWKWIKIVEDESERRLMKVKASGRLRRQGLSELFFESSEPCFPFIPDCEDGESLDPETFFKRFPEGIYEIEGRSVEGEELESEVFLSQILPAAPEPMSVNENEEAPEEGECWEAGTGDDLEIVWGEVTQSHFDKWVDTDKTPLGKSGDVEVLYYVFVAEYEDTDFKMESIVAPREVNSWTIPEEFIDLADGLMVENDEGELEPVDEVKFEIIVRVESGEHPDDEGGIVESSPGNQSASESCIEI